MLTLCICRTSAQGRGCETMIQGIVCVMGPLNALQSRALHAWNGCLLDLRIELKACRFLCGGLRIAVSLRPVIWKCCTKRDIDGTTAGVVCCMHHRIHMQFWMSSRANSCTKALHDNIPAQTLSYNHRNASVIHTLYGNGGHLHAMYTAASNVAGANRCSTHPGDHPCEQRLTCSVSCCFWQPELCNSDSCSKHDFLRGSTPPKEV